MERRYIVQERRGLRLNGEEFAHGEVVPVDLFDSYEAYDSDLTRLLNRDTVIAVPAALVEATARDTSKIGGSEEKAAETPLPEDFPGRTQLAGAGLDTVETVAAVEDLTEVSGIGPAIRGDIEDYLTSGS